ncbi:hypothetical protein [Brevibacterium sp. UCMA 11752]|uniref:hypothetical protein n=1 Tax=Brevibacterium sp. UCMA 11752 TaxID=2745946 RepID=UPI001F1D7906|nr:hypothetical protein [Brevibacterium sp. UCMA 11752]MCF2589239.1 hypothetical protein [Brevibacterium sp. UCMA 11752]
MTQPRRHQSLRSRRIRALIAGLFLVMLVLGLSGVRSTMAGWTGSDKAAGSFSAATIPAPALTKSCEFRSVLGLGARVRVYWKPPAGYQLDDIVVKASTRGLGSVLAPLTGFSLTSNTTSNGDGTYTTDVPTNLLGGLLGLGTELEIAFVAEHESGWQSKSASVASNAGLLGGIGGNCRNLT